MENEIQRNTGLTTDQFEDLLQKIPSLQLSFHGNRARASVALYIYLMKMRTGLPSADVGNKFKITRTTVDRQIEKARKSMVKDFAYNYVNYIRSHEDISQLNTEMGRGLFCIDNPNRAVIICDGTYIFIHKSRNYEFQKQTYTDQKKRNFVKIMMCVTCDGEIIYALGPYPATQNDATILISIFEKTDAFDGLQSGDIVVRT